MESRRALNSDSAVILYNYLSLARLNDIPVLCDCIEFFLIEDIQFFFLSFQYIIL